MIVLHLFGCNISSQFFLTWDVRRKDSSVNISTFTLNVNSIISHHGAQIEQVWEAMVSHGEVPPTPIPPAPLTKIISTSIGEIVLVQQPPHLLLGLEPPWGFPQGKSRERLDVWTMALQDCPDVHTALPHAMLSPVGQMYEKCFGLLSQNSHYLLSAENWHGMPPSTSWPYSLPTSRGFTMMCSTLGICTWNWRSQGPCTWSFFTDVL